MVPSISDGVSNTIFVADGYIPTTSYAGVVAVADEYVRLDFQRQQHQRRGGRGSTSPR